VTWLKMDYTPNAGTVVYYSQNLNYVKNVGFLSVHIVKAVDVN